MLQTRAAGSDTDAQALARIRSDFTDLASEAAEPASMLVSGAAVFAVNPVPPSNPRRCG
jgi:hypothetical protein